MDLRRRLVTYLGALLVGLLLMVLVVNVITLRYDVNNEIMASEQLVNVLLNIGKIGHDLPEKQAAARLAEILVSGPLRHVSISMVDNTNTLASGAEKKTSNDNPIAVRLATMLDLTPANNTGQLLEIGGQHFRIAPNPVSEIDERISDIVHFWITLLLFSGATLLVAWWSTHRALAPVRELEAGLWRLARGESEAGLPVFALREFSQVASAIDDLAEALASSHTVQRQLSSRLIRVQEDERRDLAMDLHDEMGQTLAAISVTAAYLERNAAHLDAQRVAECALELRRDVRASGEQLRAMLKRLQPLGLNALELSAILRELLTSWQQREASIAFVLCMPDALPPLGDATGMVLYRVVQEALTNVVRHSGATQCSITIEVCPDPESSSVDSMVILRIEDNGSGLPTHGIRYGCGLTGMQQRLQAAGGKLTMMSLLSPLHGLRLDISMPLNA